MTSPKKDWAFDISKSIRIQIWNADSASEEIKVIADTIRQVRNDALAEAANFHRGVGHLESCRCKRCREADKIRELQGKEVR